jgi:lipoyl(octanoyl) transferase
MVWRLIIDGPMPGSRNMAVDAALLEEVERSDGPCTIVRFYSWTVPTISLGRNQKVATAVDVGYCESAGIDIVHRPTGGRAVLHDDELTYAVVSNDAACFGDSIYGNYKRVSEALCLGYNRLGVPAVLAPETRKPPSGANGVDPPCFLSPSRYELTVEGRKIAGSAQRRVRSSFLQHGSMPITCNRETLARATRQASADPLNREMAGAAEFLSERPSIERFRDVFVAAFRDYFSITFVL